MIHRGRCRRFGGVGFAALLWLAIPSAANAGTVLGSTATPPGAVVCGVQENVGQSVVPGGVPSYAAPSDGVVTRWTFRQGALGAPGTAKLLIWRTTATMDQYIIVGKSPNLVMVADTETSGPARIPLKAGDFLGIRNTSHPMQCGINEAGNTFLVNGDPEPEPDTTLMATSGGSFRLPISAVLEPDADADGFGDESQDNCLANANANQADLDADGLGDACDLDVDGDGAADPADNCAREPNPAQNDADGDGSGDAYDPDNDNDGVDDLRDNCPRAANPDQGDRDGDGSGDACDPAADDPDTEITKAPRSKVKPAPGKKRATVQFKFSSDQPGATFLCSIDDEDPEPCESPFRAKLGRGKHTFEVAAVTSGLADPLPAKDTFRIVKRG